MIADIQFPDCCGADPTSPLISETFISGSTAYG
jgi:hypothetical protein